MSVSNTPLIKTEVELMGIEAAGFAAIFSELEDEYNIDITGETRQQVTALCSYLSECHHQLVCQGKTAPYNVKSLERKLGLTPKIVEKYALKIMAQLSKDGAIKENAQGGFDVYYTKHDTE